MKVTTLISLNVWGGICFDALTAFVKQHADSTDIFCFQEVFSAGAGLESSNGARVNLLQHFMELLPGYQVFFAPKSKGYDYKGYQGIDIRFGNAIFVRRDLKVTYHEEFFEYIDHPNHDWATSAAAKAQILQVNYFGEEYTICNFHGLWANGTNKADNLERIKQSHDVRALLDPFLGKKILIGDFNLLPKSESIRMLEHGMRNLITDYGVVSTRSSLYEKPIKFADYALVSPDIFVEEFEVLPDEVSDHLALYLKFS